MTWPVAPLLDLPGVNARVVCRTLGMTGLRWARCIDEGLDDWQADRAAVRLGVMPWDVWPDWIAAGLGPLDRLYLAGGWRQAWLYAETARARLRVLFTDSEEVGE